VQGSKNGSAIHPLSQNAMPITKLPHNTKNKNKNKKMEKKEVTGIACSLLDCSL
jgi:hypothetical protein